jgi:hypothetical protein
MEKNRKTTDFIDTKYVKKKSSTSRLSNPPPYETKHLFYSDDYCKGPYMSFPESERLHQRPCERH